MRIAVTGATGFLGTELVRRLGREHDVVALTRASGGTAGGDASAGPEGLANAVSEAAPDLVVHAAFVNRKAPGASDEDYLEEQMRVNYGLLARCAESATPVLLVGSSAVYGAAGGDDPITEESPRQPVSLYGVAKAMQEMVAEHLEAVRGLSLCRVRLFNLIGPGQALGMLVPDWVAQVSAIADGGEPVLRVYNRATSRDFVDVRDAAEALCLLAESFPAGEVFNVASGSPVSLVELSDQLASLCPREYEVEETHPVRGRSDVATQRGSSAKLLKSHGWRPTHTWHQSLADVWEGHRLKRPTT